MCFVDRSLEQVTSVCTMCKVFPPRNNYPCPHKDSMGVCKNRINHPRHDVLYFRNAELSFFNGCGFCKWAKRNPKILAGDAAWRNPGWPGCCRPPKPQDYDLIAPTDWYAVSRIHGVPPPAAVASPPSPHMPMNKSPTHSPPSKSKPIPTGPRTPERRNSGSQKDRSSHVASPPSSSSSSSGGVPSPTEGIHHRSNSDVSRRPDAPRSQSTPRDSVTRSPRAAGSSRKDSEGKNPPQDDKDRRTSTKTYNTGTIRGPPPILNPPLLRPVNLPPPKPIIASTVLPPPPAPPPSTSSSSSSSCSSLAKSGTVTSEGFTDYLSDESEIEMQREAERRAAEAELAALLEKQRIETGKEEQEFRAARIQLAGMGLQPPTAWSLGKASSGSTKSAENSRSSPQYGGNNNRATRSSSSEMYRSNPSTQLMPVYPVRQ